MNFLSDLTLINLHSRGSFSLFILADQAIQCLWITALSVFHLNEGWYSSEEYILQRELISCLILSIQSCPTNKGEVKCYYLMVELIRKMKRRWVPFLNSVQHLRDIILKSPKFKSHLGYFSYFKCEISLCFNISDYITIYLGEIQFIFHFSSYRKWSENKESISDTRCLVYLDCKI